jgi:hypothetical protein
MSRIPKSMRELLSKSNGVISEYFEKVVFQTSLPADECVDRLKENIGFDILFADLFTSHRILGWVWGHSFHLRCRRYDRNSFASILYGKIREQDGSTIIECGFAWRWSAVILITIMTLFAAAGIFFSAMLVMISVFAVGLFFFGLLTARKEEGVLLSFVKSTLKARGL